MNILGKDIYNDLKLLILLTYLLYMNTVNQFVIQNIYVFPIWILTLIMISAKIFRYLNCCYILNFYNVFVCIDMYMYERGIT